MLVAGHSTVSKAQVPFLKTLQNSGEMDNQQVNNELNYSCAPDYHRSNQGDHRATGGWERSDWMEQLGNTRAKI